MLPPTSRPYHEHDGRETFIPEKDLQAGELQITFTSSLLSSDVNQIAALRCLLAASKNALRWIARTTPIVDSDTPIYGPIADEADSIRRALREAIEKAEAITDRRPLIEDLPASSIQSPTP